MNTATNILKTGNLNTLEVKGEKFVILKKEYLDELLILFRSFVNGEELVKDKKTRGFDDFLKTVSKSRRKR